MNQREKFEAWAKRKGLIQESHGMRSEGSHSATGWEAWQAAIAAQEPKQAMSDADIHEIMAKHVDCSYAEGLAFARAIIRASSPNKELVRALREIIANDPFSVHNSSIIARAALRAAGVEAAS